LKELDGKKMSRKSLSFFMIKYYIHRYWRITPPFMLALMISANLSKYFGDGPYFPAGGFEPESCNTTWYKNLLYVHNFFDLNSTAGQRMARILFYIYY
jgi:peptidoglycan/LPS O-acetylase OafA/YrhL